MRVIEPGHIYQLSTLDGELDQKLVFVKREGVNYPGNVGTHPGTTLQETLRACLDRVYYLDRQQADSRNLQVEGHIRRAIHLLECRAAERHGRMEPGEREACFAAQCPKCLHVGCKGGCHASAA